jgi:hypothetical protein
MFALEDQLQASGEVGLRRRGRILGSLHFRRTYIIEIVIIDQN